MINTMLGSQGINSIYTNSVNSVLNGINGSSNTDETGAAELFKSIFQNAANSLNEVNDLQVASDDATMKFITGEDDNIHNVLLAQEKALVALQFTSEVTNSALEAYNEIMRMSI